MVRETCQDKLNPFVGELSFTLLRGSCILVLLPIYCCVCEKTAMSHFVGEGFETLTS